MKLSTVFTTIVFAFAIFVTVSSYSKFHIDFVVEALRQSPNKNTVVSSLELQFGLCKLASTINDPAKTEIMQALGYTSDKQLNECYSSLSRILDIFQSTDLTIVNTLFINYTLDVDEKILNGSKDNFGIDIIKVGFDYPRSAANFINKEIAAATFRRIRDVITMYDVHADTSMLFVTAAHIKPTWEMHFDLKKTRNRQFHRADNKIVYVPMMTHHGSSLYYESHNCKYFMVNLGSWGVRIGFVLPSLISGINGLLSDMQHYPDLFNNVRKNMEWKEINLIFPKFKIKNSLNLTSVLNKTGITEILKKNTTCLKKMLKQDNPQHMYLSGVKQSIFLDVDEFGVFRSFERDGESYSRGNADEKMMFDAVLDKPFYFSINLETIVLTDGRQDAPYYEIFSGVYNGPE